MLWIGRALSFIEMLIKYFLMMQYKYTIQKKYPMRCLCFWYFGCFVILHPSSPNNNQDVILTDTSTTMMQEVQTTN